ncbi:MAG TPA: hydantoinase/oxoprolinase family protein [Dissulfurispiraceae bacterium]|nr:hydantoinase/oxoprolinase family protein [Dissulfurispiraceae bacterium]
MRIGLDVGGTHTDAVLVSAEGIVSTAKIETNHDDLLTSVLSAFKQILNNADPSKIEAITLSTTLTTNILLEGKAEEVGVIVSSGPGIDPELHRIGKNFFPIDGSIDHRGEERKTINKSQLEDSVAECRKKGIRAYAAVSKFSTRNPAHELLMESVIGREADIITAGHRISGGLNFPRRINTAYFNSAVWRTFNEFAYAVAEGICSMGLSTPINILKADGGTMTFASSRNVPVQSILSGPAASIMGVTALCEIPGDAIMLDIGGTSTDIAIIAAGLPLIEPEGISLHDRPTLVRSLRTKSIAIGGDSALRMDNNTITIGPDRLGPCMASGGSKPALMDALNVAGEITFGNVEASRHGITELAVKAGRSPEEVAGIAAGSAIGIITTAVRHMIDELNERPVYTIHELLHADKIEPAELVIIGGPAQAFSGCLSRAFGLKTRVPKVHGVANAVGAALTLTTMDIELFADTERGILMVPRLSVNKPISRDYSVQDARLDAEQYLLASMDSAEFSEAQIIEASSFNMMQGARLAGRNIRVRSQIRPGLIPTYVDGVKASC